MAEQPTQSEKISIKKELEQRTIGYIVAAFGLVAGLAWNDAIKSLIEYLIPVSANSIWIKFGYAAVITAVVVLITLYLLNLVKRDSTK
ncbi:MAG TPA: hypothetical protein DIS62_01230 [Candidatus Kerfeldbacteria bacterium]|nr:MAG: hypothetical protein UY34_C0030G0011 [Parcubacteria group bacterium GW2011_GWA2_48_9]KKW16450.1 MAG: hypothetical protein UY52_C0004G0014 [Parcubacteria group bacterium GW2011_GWC2_49_9]HCJ52835.1 hypothetical protein [Candidatus Kerfeldbacteria bacterium]HCM67610.1 hypothetical protein [Candidatus Kerfeldbacteria bacterium]